MWSMKLPKINMDIDYAESILFVPAMLDMHFPLLKYAFYSKNYYPVIMSNKEDITEIGLRYINHDMCYPITLIAGQMIKELDSGKYDINRVKLLMPTAGDACRGANYIGVLRRAVDDAGYENVPILTLNVRGVDPDNMMKFDINMAWRAMFGMYYCDMLMVLLYQTRPYEKEKGLADKCWNKWIDKLSDDIISGKNLSFKNIHNNYQLMCEDFKKIKDEGSQEKKEAIGLIGELYVKYCSLGNWDVVEYVEKNGAEIHVSPLSYYALYYMDTHMFETINPISVGAGGVMKVLEKIQKDMVETLKKYDFFTLPPFRQFKEEAEGYVNYNVHTGDGWLIGAEAVGYIKNGIEKVYAAQPFGCMVSHCAGRGLYPSLTRKLKKGRIVSSDVDASSSRMNYYNRLLMLIQSKE